MNGKDGILQGQPAWSDIIGWTCGSMKWELFRFLIKHKTRAICDDLVQQIKNIWYKYIWCVRPIFPWAQNTWLSFTCVCVCGWLHKGINRCAEFTRERKGGAEAVSCFRECWIRRLRWRCVGRPTRREVGSRRLISSSQVSRHRVKNICRFECMHILFVDYIWFATCHIEESNMRSNDPLTYLTPPTNCSSQFAFKGCFFFIFGNDVLGVGSVVL